MGTIYRRRRHISTSIRGLAAMTDQQLDEIAPEIIVDGKRLQTAAQVRELLAEALAEGFECIPAEGCDNYDSRGFCKGHDVEEEHYGQVDNG